MSSGAITPGTESQTAVAQWDRSFNKTTETPLSRIRSSLPAQVVAGAFRSRIFTAMVLTGAAVAAAFFVVSNPVGWVVGAIGVSAIAAKALIAAAAASVFALGLLLQRPRKGDLAFEITALIRLCKPNNQNQIVIPNCQMPPGASLFVGALPNRLRFKKGLENLSGSNGASVYALNERWETRAHGPSIPHTRRTWRAKGIKLHQRIVKDHSLLKMEEMHKAADWIDKELRAGRNVLVHCRAGAGRSIMAAAAYFMKYGRNDKGELLSLEEICIGIKASRPRASIFDKLTCLKQYDQLLKDYHEHLGLERPESSKKYLDVLTDLEEKLKKKKRLKAPKNLVQEVMKSPTILDQIATQEALAE